MRIVVPHVSAFHVPNLVPLVHFGLLLSSEPVLFVLCEQWLVLSPTKEASCVSLNLYRHHTHRVHVSTNGKR